MRNLFAFLNKYSYSVLFIILELFCVYLVIKNSNFQKNAIFNSSNAVIGSIYSKYHNFEYYLNLKNVNDTLLAENLRLRNALKENTFEQNNTQDTLKTDWVNEKANTRVKKLYILQNAKVVNNTVKFKQNYITINKGSTSGLEPRMGVLSSNGIVGVVKSVSPNYAVVMSLLHSQSRISAKLKSNNTIGSVIWGGTDPDKILLTDIPQYNTIKIGDSVVTSGYSIYPQNQLVGTVLSYNKNISSNSWQIWLKPATNFRNLEYLYIVQNTMLQEQIQLEDSTIKADE